MDLLRPRFIVSDDEVESSRSSSSTLKPRPALTRRRSADPSMMPRIVIEESPSRANSRRGSLTMSASLSPKSVSPKSLSPRPNANETAPAPCQSGILRSIFDAITTTEMAYIALQKQQRMDSKSDDDPPSKTGRHRVMQSIREIGSKMVLTPEEHLTEQIASMRREMTQLRGEHMEQMDQIRHKCDRLERQQNMARDMMGHLRHDEGSYDRDDAGAE